MMGLKLGVATGPVGIGGWEATAAVAIFCLWMLTSGLWWVRLQPSVSNVRNNAMEAIAVNNYGRRCKKDADCGTV